MYPLHIPPLLHSQRHLNVRSSRPKFCTHYCHSRSSYMLCPVHPLRYDLPNNIRRCVQITKLLFMPLFPTSHHFIRFTSKYSLRHPVLKHPQSLFLSLAFISGMEKRDTKLNINAFRTCANECCVGASSPLSLFFMDIVRRMRTVQTNTEHVHQHAQMHPSTSKYLTEISRG
jgi:hypothetical protein